MFLQQFEIDPKQTVSDIVSGDYRTAEVFRRHGIGYCCGGKWPLDMACEMQGVDAAKILAELEAATRNIFISNQVGFASWDIDFLMDYTINVHHRYARQSLLHTGELLSEFAKEHVKKFIYLAELEKRFDELTKQLSHSMKQEEEVLFPYIRHIAHAHKGKEPYAVMLVRTLRKPLEDALFKNHDLVRDMVLAIRALTNRYSIPQNACTSHKVVIARLKELDNEIMQHCYLEQFILLPRAIAIEKEVLAV
jgi:regulator of cell morphogenesis and NO signaling